jgi:pimeloyl-ACP methyl ester carboxylesterase
MNLFARLYPAEVSGLVLLDSSHPEQFEYLRKEKPLRHALMVTGYSTGQPNLRYELANMNRFHREVDEAGAFPDIPVIVLTAGESPSWQGEEERNWWLGLQEELANLSPRSRSQIVESSGHFIQRDRPQVVVDAIKELLDAGSGDPAMTTARKTRKGEDQ